MMRFLPILVFAAVSLAPAAAVGAALSTDIAQCAQIADDAARLACFDAVARRSGTAEPGTPDAAGRRALDAALQREFRFDPGLKTGDYSFRIAVSGDLQISRGTAAAREIERLVRRIGKAFGSFDAWGVDVTVHGASVALSRGHPYSGEELAQQAADGLARSGLGVDRYTVAIGEPARPRLWDDGRIRDANEYVDVAITGLE